MQVNGGTFIVLIASFSSGHCIIHALDPAKLAEELNYLIFRENPTVLA